jgi:proteasome component ECM29
LFFFTPPAPTLNTKKNKYGGFKTARRPERTVGLCRRATMPAGANAARQRAQSSVSLATIEVKTSPPPYSPRIVRSSSTFVDFLCDHDVRAVNGPVLSQSVTTFIATGRGTRDMSSTDDPVKAAQADLASLGRVSHRLAMVDTTERLQQVLDKLLPRLLRRIGDNHKAQQATMDDALRRIHEQIHAKLVEMLSHTMKRVRDDQACRLPCPAILRLLLREQESEDDLPERDLSVDAFTINLALTFLTTGLPRCETAELEEMLPGLLECQTFSYQTLASPSLRSQAHQLAHLLLRCIERLVREDKSSLLRAGSDAAGKPRSRTEKITAAREVCRTRPETAATVYDLLLDVLLYQPVSGNIPPAGLSQAGQERLRVGHSSTERDWAAEMAHPARRVLLKTAVLDFIAPSRRWGLFLSSDNGEGPVHWHEAGLARTVALLITASGDVSGEVSERATSYLKAHFDSYRGKTTDSSSQVIGEPVQLSTSLLSLCLGHPHASLGRNEAANGTETTQLILSTRRRPVGEAVSSAILSFVSSKILEEYPNLLDSTDPAAVLALGTLAVSVANKSLSDLSTGSSGLSTQRAKPYLAAAQLLSSLSVRLSVHYDMNPEGTDGVVDLMARCLSTACAVLSPVSSIRSSTSNRNAVSNDGSIAVRDSCYGVIGTLSRSQFALVKEGYVFSLGTKAEFNEMSDDDALKMSTGTAKMLFGCAPNEEERLRPRAVAALDALLGAYRRAYREASEEKTVVRAGDTESGAENPWLNAAAQPGALANVESTISVDRSGLARALLPLIWTAAQGHQTKASRVTAAQWASDLLKDLDLVSGCHILCFLAGDSDATAANLAREGLGLPKNVDDDVRASSDAGHLPGFSDFAQVLFRAPDAGNSSSRLHRYWDFSVQGKGATLRFGLLCLLNDFYGGEDEAVGLYLSALTETLSAFTKEIVVGDAETRWSRSSIDLLDESSASLLSTLSASQYARSRICDSSSTFRINDIQNLALKANSARARKHLAAACGRLFADKSIWAANEEHAMDPLNNYVTASQLDRALNTCANCFDNLHKHKFDLVNLHGCVFLGAHAGRAFRLGAIQLQGSNDQVEQWWSQTSAIIEGLGKGILHPDEIVANACADGLAIALSYDCTDAPILDPRLYECCTFVLATQAEALTSFGRGDLMDPSRATRIVHAAGLCLAATTSGSGVVQDKMGWPVNLGSARADCVNTLFELLGSEAFRKQEEIALVTGEALADYADSFSPDNAVWSHSDSVWPTEFTETFANKLPPHEHVLYVLLRRVLPSSSPHKKIACAPALLAVVARCTNRLNANGASSSRVLVRSVLNHLEEIQKAFISLLSFPKSKQFARESCCLGLAACRGLLKLSMSENGGSSLSSDELNHRLLQAFGQTTAFGGSAYMETQAQAEARRENERREAEGRPATNGNSGLLEPLGIEEERTETGGASGIGEAALGAYREMASASVALGRHDVLYTLLVLSVTHSYWISAEAKERYSGSSLLGENSFLGSAASASEMRKALRPHLGKLLSRVLRACNDPNKQTREQMSALWIGLTGGGAEGRAAITQHLLATIDSLIEEASSKLWRARVGACGALSEIIVGRDWNELGGGGPVLSDDDLSDGSTGSESAGVRLLRLWRVAMRSMDDVRGAVRDSGEKLARSVRALTVRLVDPSKGEKSAGNERGRDKLPKMEQNASAAAATSLRWLIRHGLNQQCAEATGLCISTLAEVVGAVRPKILEPILPDLLRLLLLAISGLEPAALNYLQLRVSDQEGLERVRLQLAQYGPIASAVGKCLELIPSVSLDTQQKVVPELDAALRLSSGFATRAATADAVSSLCSSCPSAFRFSSSSSSNPSVRLLRALYFAGERERGSGSKDRMIHALGNLAALCPGSSVRSLALRACERYETCTGINDDPVSRRAAAAAIRAIAVRASNHFADGGPGEIWVQRVLPVAFLGRKDSDPKIASLWNEVWSEGGTSANLSNSSSMSFGTTLEEKLLPSLIRGCVSALQDVSWSRRVSGAAAIGDLCDLGILGPIPRSTSSASSLDPAKARRRAEASNAVMRECVTLLAKPRLWTGKSEVLKAVVNLASTWAAAEAAKDADEQVLYGWDEEGRNCRWRPLAVSPGQFADDLFIGDGWFSKMAVEDNASDEDQQVAQAEQMDVEETKEDVKIDFDQCDNVPDENGRGQGIETTAKETFEVVTFTGLSRLLIDQAFLPNDSFSSSSELLPYKTAAFQSFRDLLNSMPPDCTAEKMEIYDVVAPKIIELCTKKLDETGSSKKVAPVLVAGAIEGLGSCFWEGIGSGDTGVAHADPKELTRTLKEVGGKFQPAWTVRESANACLAELASKCSADALRQHVIVSWMIETATYALADRKFWRVRYAGLKVLDSLVNRAGKAHDASGDVQTRQLILEALLPHKEVMVRLVRSSFGDSEAQVTALGSTVSSNMSWWP